MEFTVLHGATNQIILFFGTIYSLIVTMNPSYCDTTDPIVWGSDNTPGLHPEVYGPESRPVTSAILTYILRAFPQSLLGREIGVIKPGLFPYKCFSIHRPSIILSRHAVQSTY
jgi:hypothetical protein